MFNYASLREQSLQSGVLASIVLRPAIWTANLGSVLNLDASFGYAVPQRAEKAASGIELAIVVHSWFTVSIEAYPKGLASFAASFSRENRPYTISTVHKIEKKPVLFVFDGGDNASQRTINKEAVSWYQVRINLCIC